MKKLIIPGLVALFVAGLSQAESRAGISIGISIGDRHRPHPPVVISRPPVVVHRPPVVVHRPPVVVHRPPVVVVPPRYDRCDHRYARHCDHGPRYSRYERYDHRHGHGHGKHSGWRR